MINKLLEISKGIFAKREELLSVGMNDDFLGEELDSLMDLILDLLDVPKYSDEYSRDWDYDQLTKYFRGEINKSQFIEKLRS